MAAPSSAASPSRANAILGFTRFVAVLLGIVVLYAAVVLTLFPERAAALFAWNIQPPMSGAFMGAAYANGVVFFAAVIAGRAWHRIAAPHFGVFAFATLLLIATVLHWPRFNHAHPVFWAWLFIYSVAPVLVPIAFFRNRGQDPGVPDARDAEVPFALRVAWAVLGAAALVWALAAFVDPALAISIWPWKLTPLTARVVTAFCAIFGVGPLSVLFERRWSAWRIGAFGMTLWHALLLVAAWRLPADFAAPLVSTPWFWTECGVLAATLLTVVVMESRRRSSPSGR